MAGVIPGSLESGGAKLLYPYTIDDATLASSNVAEADYATWASGTNYAAGARVIRVNTHRIYERVVQGVSTVLPEIDPTNWVDIGATNRWRMFDSAVGSVTSSAGATLSVSLTLGPVNDIVLLNVTGSNVTITKPGGSQVSQVVPAQVIPGEGSAVVFTGLAGTTGTYVIAVSGSGTVSVGSACLGKFISIGSCDYGASVGIIDYSTKSFDNYGAITLVQRDYAKKLTVPFTLSSSNVDQTVNILAALRSIPVIWVGVQSLGSTVIYGAPRDWSIQASNSVLSSGTLNLESLAVGNLPATGA
jgi:hypothetical protein